MINIRKSAIDIGNDSLKGIFGDEKVKMSIPNAITPAGKIRGVKELEKETLDGLHITINSSALKVNGNYLVGKLATNQQDVQQLNKSCKKSANDQTLILLLTSLAVDAASCGKFDEMINVIEATYYLSTGLPVDEGSESNRKLFSKLLEEENHEVTFLETPQLANKTVILHFKKVFTNVEGSAAYVTLNEKNPNLANEDIFIYDIGGLTTDIVTVFQGKLINQYCKSIPNGTAAILELITNSIYHKYRYSFNSREEVVEAMKNTDENGAYIYLFGKKVNIQDEVNEEMKKAASQHFNHILAHWQLVPKVQKAYLIGGGTVLLKEYISSEMVRQGYQLPLHFENPDTSIWANVNSYYNILNVLLNKLHLQGMTQYDIN